MSARLNKRFADLARANRAGLVAYIMASDPDHETCLEILRGLPAAGADVIELGFPFSDPMADGPAIQRAGQRALKSGGSLRKTLELARRFREADQSTPLVLMGYANPIEQMTADVFAREANASGVDGAIIVDLPPEEDHETRTALAAKDIALIRLAAPTTDDKRLTKLLDGASGFLYYVSVAGVTGANAATGEHVRAAVTRLKRATSLPVAVGFGVRTPEAAAEIARVADAVVIGSAFVDEIAPKENGGEGKVAIDRVLRKVKVLSDAVRSARKLEGTAP